MKTDATEPNSPAEIRITPNGGTLASIPEIMTHSHNMHNSRSETVSIDARSKRSMKKQRALPFNPLRYLATRLKEIADEKAALKAEEKRFQDMIEAER